MRLGDEPGAQRGRCQLLGEVDADVPVGRVVVDVCQVVADVARVDVAPRQGVQEARGVQADRFIAADGRAGHGLRGWPGERDGALRGQGVRRRFLPGRNV